MEPVNTNLDLHCATPYSVLCEYPVFYGVRLASFKSRKNVYLFA